MPLVAHGGIAFSGLNDVTFTKVRRSATLGEEELFQRTTDEDNSTAFTLFLGWQFYGKGNDVETDQRKSKIGMAFSLGTDVRPNVFRIIREQPKPSYFFSLSTRVY